MSKISIGSNDNNSKEFISSEVINQGVVDFMSTTNILSGSGSDYDLYTLLDKYINNIEIRHKINDIIL